jgi:ribosomal-protein-alanine N-acetyltransferase
MEEGPQVRTRRLLLRRWREEDLEPFAAMNADPEVMEHFPSTHSRTMSDELVQHIEACFAEHGFGAWAVEVVGEAPLIGFVGLFPVSAEMTFAPAIEIGWRIARPWWGRGIAHEAAEASLAFGFRDVGLPEIVAYTSSTNLRSQRLMERLGMVRDAAEDFDHPRVPAGHRLARHFIYRLTAERWQPRAHRR